MNNKARAPGAGLALSMLAGLAACATTATPTVVPYGPLSVNLARGADFYVVQHGTFAPAAIKNGVVVILLANEPFTDIRSMIYFLSGNPQ